ncbi:MAG TPA: BF3164 family lipoprotein [Draconibacterium sp.]|nr:BF3164 family lipoprotein [Draconibacterium sp.]
MAIGETGLNACKTDNVILHENIISFSEFPKKIDITFTDLSEYKTGNPRTLQLVDSTLFLFNFTKNIESFFYNFDLKTKKLSNGYLDKGRGPNEAIGACCTGIVDNKLWAYDVTLKKIFTLDKTIALNNDDKIFSSGSVKDNFYQIALKDTNNFFVCGKTDSEYKIQKLDFSGKLLDQFGEFYHIPKAIPIDALKDAYHSFFYLKPSGEKLALSYLYTDVIEIYNIKDPSQNIALQGPDRVDLNFHVAKRRNYNYMEKNEEIRKTFLSGAVTNEYIYLAYSGLSYAEKDDMDYCSSVYVYSWDGSPIKKLNLDRRITCLTVSEDNKIIYSFDADNGFLVKAEIE